MFVLFQFLFWTMVGSALAFGLYIFVLAPLFGTLFGKIFDGLDWLGDFGGYRERQESDLKGPPKKGQPKEVNARLWLQ